MSLSKYCLPLFLILLSISTTFAQEPSLKKDYSYSMEIPEVMAISSSPAHMYVLSETEGLVVFRTHADSLQWLYSSSDMAQRGDRMTSDIRFSYLMGDDNRLTILEPTSVLGIYSSTELPSKPLDAKRIEQTLFVALEQNGLGQLSLQSPASVDSTVTYLDAVKDEKIVDLEASEDELFALSEEQKLYTFTYDDSVSLKEEQELSEPATNIFYLNEFLYGSDQNGEIYRINTSGESTAIGSIEEPVLQINPWGDWLIIKGESGKLWTSYQEQEPSLWKENSDAGNYFTVAKEHLWLSEYDQLNTVLESSSSESNRSSTSFDGSMRMQEISSQAIPHSQPLILPIRFESDIPAEAVQITYRSETIKDAEIRGQSFYWRPGSGDTGTHRFKIIANAEDGATDSTAFNVEVQSFNSPPRFSPIRPVSIPVGEEYTLPIRATDPDGMNRDLMRYIGVDLPEGASIDETTGDFTWTPTARQEGENKFRIIATDQYGAAASQDIEIKVVENKTPSDSLDN